MADIKINEPCSRCGRNTEVRTDSVDQAQAVLQRMDKKTQRAKQIETFIRTLPVSELPDVVLVTRTRVDADGFQMVVHTHLCSKDGEGRACFSRVADLTEQMGVLPERQKPAKKTKTGSEPASPEKKADAPHENHAEKHKK